MKHCLLLFLIIGFGFFSFGQSQNVAKNGRAVQGYDLVSYFKQSQPQLGRKEHQVTHQNNHYYFSSNENKTKFLANPQKYLPAFGGWCAFAMAKGKKVDVNPLAYTIENEKLYLFYKTIFTDTRSKWIQNTDHLRPKAEKHWAKLKEIQK